MNSHRPPSRPPAAAAHRRSRRWRAGGALLLWAAVAAAQTEPTPLDPALRGRLQQLVEQAAQAVAAPLQARVEVAVGQLDPNLRLAPCERIEPYLPPGMRAAGSLRLGLRCLQGPTRWNVYLPVTVKLWGRALVAQAGLPAGTVLEARHLQLAEVDLAAGSDLALRQASEVLNRTLARPLAAGDALRAGDLRKRQWFNAGDTVRVVAVGNGFAISAEGLALSPGVEGQPVRVRTESGRVVSGQPVAERRVEVLL